MANPSLVIRGRVLALVTEGAEQVWITSELEMCRFLFSGQSLTQIRPHSADYGTAEMNAICALRTMGGGIKHSHAKELDHTAGVNVVNNV